MARPLKVYGATTIRPRDCPAPPGREHHRQIRMVVAAPTKKAAAEAMDMGAGDFRHFAGETGNQHEIAAAMAAPGRALWCELDHFIRSPDALQAWAGQDAAAERRADALVRKAEFDARVAERQAEREAARERAGENDRAAAMWAARLLEEWGIESSAAGNGKVEVLADPERLYGRLVDLVGVLRDLGFSPEELSAVP